MDEIYDRYVKLRNALGLRDADVARSAALTRSALSDWKSGRAMPKQDKMVRIAAALNTTVEYLVTGSDSRENVPEFDPAAVRIMAKFYKLNDDQQVIVEDMMDMYIAKNDK